MRAMMAVAMVVSRENGADGPLEHIGEVVVRDVRGVADLYLARFQATYAAMRTSEETSTHV